MFVFETTMRPRVLLQHLLTDLSQGGLTKHEPHVLEDTLDEHHPMHSLHNVRD